MNTNQTDEIDSMNNYETARGPTCFLRGDRRPNPQTGIVWQRHDRVFYNGRKLEGSVMERARIVNGREVTERCTFFREECVRVADMSWLRRRNEQEAHASAPLVTL